MIYLAKASDDVKKLEGKGIEYLISKEDGRVLAVFVDGYMRSVDTQGSVYKVPKAMAEAQTIGL